MILAVLISTVAAPLALTGSLFAWLRLRRGVDERQVIAALDRLLEEQSAALKRERRSDPLRFRTAERIRLPGLGWGLGVRSGRVDLVRVVRAATPSGYRLRLRAFARLLGGRTLVRSVDVDVDRARR